MGVFAPICQHGLSFQSHGIGNQDAATVQRTPRAFEDAIAAQPTANKNSVRRKSCVFISIRGVFTADGKGVARIGSQPKARCILSHEAATLAVGLDGENPARWSRAQPFQTNRATPPANVP